MEEVADGWGGDEEFGCGAEGLGVCSVGVGLDCWILWLDWVGLWGRVFVVRLEMVVGAVMLPCVLGRAR